MSDGNITVKFYLIYIIDGESNHYIHSTPEGDLVLLSKIKGAQRFRLNQAKAFIEAATKSANTQYYLQAIE